MSTSVFLHMYRLWHTFSGYFRTIYLIYSELIPDDYDNGSVFHSESSFPMIMTMVLYFTQRAHSRWLWQWFCISLRELIPDDYDNGSVFHSESSFPMIMAMVLYFTQRAHSRWLWQWFCISLRELIPDDYDNGSVFHSELIPDDYGNGSVFHSESSFPMIMTMVLYFTQRAHSRWLWQWFQVF